MSVKFLERRPPCARISGDDGDAHSSGFRKKVKKALLNLNLDIPSLVDAQAVAFKDYRVAHTPGYICWTPKRGRF